MSFVTRCPACATHFRVVADQLKISDGWVRCGQCGEVFDASVQLAALPATEPAAGSVVAGSDATGQPAGREPDQAPWLVPQQRLDHTPQEAPAEPTPAAPSDAFAPAPTSELPGPFSDEPQATSWDASRNESRAGPSEASFDAWAVTTFVELPELAGSASLIETPAPAQPQSVRPAPQPWALSAEAPPAADKRTDPDDARDSMYDLPPAAELLPPAAPAADEMQASEAVLAAFPEQVGFVRQAQRREGWQRPLVRWSLALLSVFLCLALLLQWVVFERDRIAALRPDLRPALQALCQPLGCRVEPLRLVQALSIDSTTLARRGNGRYALEVVVRNASVFELALPALELSLTDVGDQLLLRRVILPTELPAPLAAVPANDTLTLRLEVLIDGSVGDALAGYRTLVFYP